MAQHSIVRRIGIRLARMLYTGYGGRYVRHNSQFGDMIFDQIYLCSFALYSSLNVKFRRTLYYLNIVYDIASM